MKRYFQPALEAAGLRQFRFHDLRHTFGSLLIQDGAPLAYVKEQMGHHSSIQITVDTYGHLIARADIAWVDRLDSNASPHQNAPQAYPRHNSDRDEFLEEFVSGDIEGVNWCALRDSNSRPTDSKSSKESSEITATGAKAPVINDLGVHSKTADFDNSAKGGQMRQNPHPPRTQKGGKESAPGEPGAVGRVDCENRSK